MRYLSVCSGVEAASVAWEPLGWEPVAFSEIEPFPAAVLTHRFPRVPNWGDMTKFEGWPDADVDLLVGGTPCQSFSVAGLRKGLADPRGNLMLTYLAIARRYRPRWLVWENVPGVLSVDGGRAFGALVRGMAELGYHAAWRVLDAQYVRTCSHPGAVPQRRRRVFVVGYLGDWRRAAAVLFDPEGLRGDPPPRREAGQAAPTIPSRSSAGGGLGTDFDLDGGLVAYDDNYAADGRLIASTGDVSHCLNAGGMGRIDYESETRVAHALRGEGVDASEDGTGRGTPLVAFSCKDHGADAGAVSPPLRALNHDKSHANAGGQVAVAFDLRGREGGAVPEGPHDTANLRAAAGGSSRSYVAEPWQVRRLTPLECERLQGFPDGWTAVPYRGGQAKDGPRYKAVGNSMAVNVMRLIGERIQYVETPT